uniref:(northern house mosquito) hypothetical protein n=1 Tax=Culex pipiens TaxID=7175 RepID=A0A8D8L3C0_CULPI
MCTKQQHFNLAVIMSYSFSIVPSALTCLNISAVRALNQKIIAGSLSRRCSCSGNFVLVPIELNSKLNILNSVARRRYQDPATQSASSSVTFMHSRNLSAVTTHKSAQSSQFRKKV